MVYQVRPERRAEIPAVTHRRLGTPADRFARGKRPLLSTHCRLYRAHWRARFAQHVVQRKRADRLHPGPRYRLLF